MLIGRVLFYVGEGSHGCTADIEFHNYIGGDSWTLIDTVIIPQFSSIHDYLFIYRKVK